MFFFETLMNCIGGIKSCFGKKTEECLKKLPLGTKQSCPINFLWSVFVYEAERRPGKEKGRRVSSHAGELWGFSQLWESWCTHQESQEYRCWGACLPFSQSGRAVRSSYIFHVLHMSACDFGENLIPSMKTFQVYSCAKFWFQRLGIFS